MINRQKKINNISNFKILAMKSLLFILKTSWFFCFSSPERMHLLSRYQGPTQSAELHLIILMRRCRGSHPG